MRTLADTVVPASWTRAPRTRFLSNAALVVLGSVVVALSAQARIDLGFTPVPITGQTFGVLLVGAALGPRRAALSLLTYLAEGAAGLPVFAGGSCCVGALLGPTGGYLLSYPLAAALVGWLAHRGWDRRPLTAAPALVAGNLAIYLIGLPWLAVFVGLDRVLIEGLLPFVPGDAVKLVLAALALPAAWKIVDLIAGIRR